MNDDSAPIERKRSDESSLETLIGVGEHIHAHNAGEAETATARLLSPHRLTITGQHGLFDLDVARASFSQISVMLMRYGAEVMIDRPAQEGYVAIHMPLSGTVVARTRHEDNIAWRNGNFLVLPEEQQVHMQWSSSARVIALQIDAKTLRSTLAAMLPGTEITNLRFTPAVTSSTSRAAVMGVASMLANAAPRGAHIGVAARYLRETALSTLLLGLEHNYSDQLYAPQTAVSNRVVRHAMDIVDSETMAGVTVVDLSRRVAISLRALEVGFRRELGVTPHQYLQDVRLNRARQELLLADHGSGFTVGQIALKWGFAHAGRFSERYRAAYGEFPAETLRRSPTAR